MCQPENITSPREALIPRNIAHYQYALPYLGELTVEVRHDGVYEVVTPRSQDEFRLELKLLFRAAREIQRKNCLTIGNHRLDKDRKHRSTRRPVIQEGRMRSSHPAQYTLEIQTIRSTGTEDFAWLRLARPSLPLLTLPSTTSTRGSMRAISLITLISKP